jgi:hypothetical protein
MTHPRLDLDTQHFRTALARDVGHFLVGDHLGGGQYREVFAYGPDPKRKVIKLEDGYASFANIREHDAWRALRDTAYARWLAPCLDISGNGIMLIQARTTPVKFDDLPKEVPAFFTDLKRSNWGRYKGRIVCHDYGNHLLLKKGITARMRKADWSE